ncbi:hypothetical protein BDV26DRAFT_296787 [Aspergillus bertholletiae]|uniref:Uncharacterized protein n=1 Tax=Aspergillus bertholletiae TaxID=1226010 RepID=A0A5N7AUT7_9EURO|nr:hypothetical protein BDV26DRAFT_296787 [Aspergillus bertholletiae]
MSFYRELSQCTWRQPVHYTPTAYLRHQQNSESTYLQQSLTDGYSLQTKNHQLIQAVCILLCENEKYLQDCEAAYQSYQLAQYVLYVLQLTCETQEHYFHLAERASKETEGLDTHFRFRGYTIDHLHTMVENARAMIDEYQYRITQLDNVCWAADVCAWRHTLAKEGEILWEILFRISRAADEMEALCRGYRQFLADRMDVVSDIDDESDTMWLAASQVAADNGDLAALYEESENEYESHETIPWPSVSIPPGGYPNLGGEQMLANGTQPPQEMVTEQNGWLRM